MAAITSFECLLYYVVVWVPFYYPLKLGTLMYLQLARMKLNPKPYLQGPTPSLGYQLFYITAYLKRGGRVSQTQKPEPKRCLSSRIQVRGPGSQLASLAQRPRMPDSPSKAGLGWLVGLGFRV